MIAMLRALAALTILTAAAAAADGPAAVVSRDDVVSRDAAGAPGDLRAAVAALGEIIPAGDLAELERNPAAAGEVVDTLGVAIRSRWNLWEDSPLVGYFHRMGVQHPEHMSGIILQAWMDTRAGRPLDEAAVFRNFPSWLNAKAELALAGTVDQALARLRARATEIARLHFEDPCVVVAFSHAFDPAKGAATFTYQNDSAIYQDVLTVLCAEAQLRVEVVSPAEIRIADASPPTPPTTATPPASQPAAAPAAAPQRPAR
jgi:hypothetical protein